MRSIRSYVDQDKTEVVKARISVEMKERLQLIADQNGWTPSDMVRAGLQKFLDDEKPRQQSFKLRPMQLDPEQSANKSHWK